MNRKLKTKQEYYIKRFMELPTTIIGHQEIKYAKQYIKELEENSGVLVSQVESWSKSSDDYLEKYHKLLEQKKELKSWLEKEIIDSKAGSSQYYWFGRVLSKLNELKDSDVDE